MPWPLRLVVIFAAVALTGGAAVAQVAETTTASVEHSDLQASASLRAQPETFWVQAGEFQTTKNAHRQCDLLVRQGRPFAVVQERVSGGPPLFVCRSTQTYPRPEAIGLARALRDEAATESALVVATAPASGDERVKRAKRPFVAPLVRPEHRREFERFMAERAQRAEQAALRKSFQEFLDQHPHALD